MANVDVESEPSMMATVNAVIDELHGSLGLSDSDFFCECGHSGCKERISLTRTEYAKLRQDGGPLVVADHAHRRPGVFAQPHDLAVGTPASGGAS